MYGSTIPNYQFKILNATAETAEMGHIVHNASNITLNLMIGTLHHAALSLMARSMAHLPILDYAVFGNRVAFALPNDYLPEQEIFRNEQAHSARILQLRNILKLQNLSIEDLGANTFLWYHNDLFISPTAKISLNSWSVDFDRSLLKTLQSLFIKIYTDVTVADFLLYLEENSLEEIIETKEKHIISLRPGERTAFFIFYVSLLKKNRNWPDLKFKKNWKDLPGFKEEIELRPLQVNDNKLGIHTKRAVLAFCSQ